MFTLSAKAPILEGFMLVRLLHTCMPETVMSYVLKEGYAKIIETGAAAADVARVDVAQDVPLAEPVWRYLAVVDRERTTTIVPLSRRKQLIRVMEVLRYASAESSKGVPTMTLFRRAWLGEHACSRSASNRVRVAVATLRSMGLGSLIETTADGYRLSQACTWSLRSDVLTISAA